MKPLLKDMYLVAYVSLNCFNQHRLTVYVI